MSSVGRSTLEGQYYAMTGDNNALREWLRAHPDCLNKCTPDAPHTLVYMAVVRGHIETVRMLVNEFGADLSISCGALGDTCLHAAVQRSDVELLSFLMISGAPLKANAIGKFPQDMLEGAALQSPEGKQCLGILSTHYRFSGQPAASSGTENKTLSKSCAKSGAGEMRDLISKLSISQGDSCVVEGEWPKAGPVSTKWPQHVVQEEVVGVPSSSRGQPSVDCGVANAGAAILRGMRKFSENDRLPYDMEVFRRRYGNGFEYSETTRHYQIRGLLPYSFKGVVYYTPIIFVLAKPRAGGVEESQRSAVLQYRALIDRNGMAQFSISRRARYIDPNTAAIIPSISDTMYRTFIEFVEKVVISNFENVPPLTANAEHSINAQVEGPLFAPSLTTHGRRIRILRDLSLFCDSTFSYDSVTHAITGFIPILVDVQLKYQNGECVLLGTENTSNRVVTGEGASQRVLAMDMPVRLPFKMQFGTNGRYNTAPCLYLTNATRCTAESQLNYAFLAEIVSDSATGEVSMESLASLKSWQDHGSVKKVLEDLQNVALQLLLRYCKKNRIPANPPARSSERTSSQCERSLGGNRERAVKSSSVASSENVSAVVANGANDRPKHSEEASCRATAPPTAGPSRVPTMDGRMPLSTVEANILKKCLVCLEADKTMVLLPCMHLLLCHSCADVYKDRLSDGLLCLACRKPVEGVSRLQ
ncbi:Ankyrin repeats (many copies) Zinc finger C3HC4 type (RING finger) [Trypanosoma vivax]|uniref:RING-type domain-containing protein n=1 Tax=Trypanosoma vivax (strain Y486) TaxID=1055687 RepID=G0TRP9_TRYVY|nr:Ankyrin repeats (many copies) Zinc finger C3HC4 type (RING finger) [Trypanosoma vivax]CCC46620.1 conserved hypothetical protein [Trypanosoma vivax Y486]